MRREYPNGFVRALRWAARSSAEADELLDAADEIERLREALGHRGGSADKERDEMKDQIFTAAQCLESCNDHNCVVSGICLGRAGWQPRRSVGADELLDAADEIERLREVLSNALAVIDGEGGTDTLDKARAVLAKMEDKT
jgi:hypothetical protein